jgi:hypothetical protein
VTAGKGGGGTEQSKRKRDGKIDRLLGKLRKRGGNEGSGEDIECPKCTFLNRSGTRTCRMCGGRLEGSDGKASMSSGGDVSGGRDDADVGGAEGGSVNLDRPFGSGLWKASAFSGGEEARCLGDETEGEAKQDGGSQLGGPSEVNPSLQHWLADDDHLKMRADAQGRGAVGAARRAVWNNTGEVEKGDWESAGGGAWTEMGVRMEDFESDEEFDVVGSLRGWSKKEERDGASEELPERERHSEAGGKAVGSIRDWSKVEERHRRLEMEELSSEGGRSVKAELDVREGRFETRGPEESEQVGGEGGECPEKAGGRRVGEGSESTEKVRTAYERVCFKRALDIGSGDASRDEEALRGGALELSPSKRARTRESIDRAAEGDPRGPKAEGRCAGETWIEGLQESGVGYVRKISVGAVNGRAELTAENNLPEQKAKEGRSDKGAEGDGRPNSIEGRGSAANVGKETAKPSSNGSDQPPVQKVTEADSPRDVLDGSTVDDSVSAAPTCGVGVRIEHEAAATQSTPEEAGNIGQVKCGLCGHLVTEMGPERQEHDDFHVALELYRKEGGRLQPTQRPGSVRMPDKQRYGCGGEFKLFVKQDASCSSFWLDIFVPAFEGHLFRKVEEMTCLIFKGGVLRPEGKVSASGLT